MLSLGVPAQADRAFISDLAVRVEAMPFHRLWLNDTPMADGIADAETAIDSTTSLSVGIGVVAIDRRSPRQIIEALGPPTGGRVLLGIGAGFSTEPLGDVRRAVAELRLIAPEQEVAVAAMGPKMCRLAGEIADVVLLNWMTPARISWAQDQIAKGASGRDDGKRPKVAAYVRVAIGDGGPRLLRDEAARYASLPHYARHFAAMGEPAPGIASSDDEAKQSLAAYHEVCDEVVARALAHSRDELLNVAEALI